jgi:hypothetical protein
MSFTDEEYEKELAELRRVFGDSIPINDITPEILTLIIKGSDCHDHVHRDPQGPNEDTGGWCVKANRPMFAIRPAGETFGHHIEDCSLPIDHLSYCVGGGTGHPPAKLIRG